MKRRLKRAICVSVLLLSVCIVAFSLRAPGNVTFTVLATVCAVAVPLSILLSLVFVAVRSRRFERDFRRRLVALGGALFVAEFDENVWLAFVRHAYVMSPSQRRRVLKWTLAAVLLLPPLSALGLFMAIGYATNSPATLAASERILCLRCLRVCCGGDRWLSAVRAKRVHASVAARG